MRKHYFIFLLLLNACESNGAESAEQLPEMLRKLEQQRIGTLLRSKEATLAYKKELITAGEKQNKIQAAVLAMGALTVIGSLFSKHIHEPIYREDFFEIVYATPVTLYATLAEAFGLVIMAIGAYLPHKDIGSLQADIDHAKENIKQLQTILATLQTSPKVLAKHKID